MRRVRLGTGLLASAAVFAAFSAYAFLAPASYRSSALVVCDGCKGPRQAQSLDDVTLSLELEQALLAPATLRELTTELGSDAAALSPLAAARRVRSSLEIESTGAEHFVVSYTDSSPDRAQRLADLMSRRAIERLPVLFEPPPSDAKARAAEELSAFVARHPELFAGAPVTLDPGPAVERATRDLRLLRLERRRLSSRLHDLMKADGSQAKSADNPYSGEPSLFDDPKRLRQRIAEIDSLLASASTRPSHPPDTVTTPSLAEADRAELTRLFEALKTSSNTPPKERIEARVVAPANRPDSPISPPRGLIMGLGALFAIAAGVAAAFLPTRRRPSSKASLPAPQPKDQAAPRRARATSVLFERPATGPGSTANPRRSPTPEVVFPPVPTARILSVAGAGLPSLRREPLLEPRGREPQARHTLMMGSVESATGGASHLSTRDTVPLEILAEPVSPRPRGDARRDARDIVPYSDLVDQGALVTPYEVPVGWHPDSTLDVERLRGMAQALYPLAAERTFVLAVTGTADAASDKSRTAAELALALAEFAHRRVLLLEGNFTRPAIQRFMRLRVPNAYGFTRQLQAFAERRLYGGWKVIRCTQWLDVCAEGSVRTPGAILGEDFVAALGELERHYGFIVIDGPSLEEASDCRALDRSLEGVVVVRKHGATLSEARLSSLFTHKRFATVIESAA